jgi:hypothetical protein
MKETRKMDKRTLKRRAAAKGHQLGRFKERKLAPMFSTPTHLYYVAWCQKCEAAAFTGDDDNGAALRRRCGEYNEFLTQKIGGD